MKKREKGFLYEEIAKEYLVSKGMEFVCQNFYSRFGEIDLIFFEKETLVFVEVKYRKNIDFGNSIEMVDKRKIEKIKLTSEIYLLQKGYFKRNLETSIWNGNIRYDIIGINGNNKINWIKNAF